MSANARNAGNAGKKRGGGFLARQAKAKTTTERKLDKGQLAEEELLHKDSVSPEDVLRLNKITESKYFLSK